MRNLSTAMLSALTAQVLYPAILVDLTFTTGTVHLWTGIGPITANSNTYQGVGTLGKIGNITETTSTMATGTTVTLSGIDPTLYADCMTEIQTGQPANIWLAMLSGTTAIDTTLLFSGLIDAPQISESADDVTITLALETKLSNLQRAGRKLWTPTEQRRVYPHDSGFDFVPILADEANVWG